MPRGGAAATPPCETHHIQDCIMCNTPVKSPPSMLPLSKLSDLSPSDPPDNIEGWLAEGKGEPVITMGGHGTDGPVAQELRQMQVQAKPEVSFAALPTDDSLASKIMRAAADFSRASDAYAKAIVAVGSLKSAMLVEEARLEKAKKLREDSETELQRLTKGDS